LEPWDYSRGEPIIPLKNDEGMIIPAKIILYAGENDQHYSFVTTEAYQYLKNWMDYRESYGEKITGESWLMRNLWKTTNIKYGSKNGLAKYPNRLKSSGVKSLVGKALFQQNVRPILEKGKKSHISKDCRDLAKTLKPIVNKK
jgi:hypothetical protein